MTSPPVNQGAPDTVGRHLPLSHGFQQRRLGPRARAVHLVSQHHVREYGTRYKLETVLSEVEDRGPGDIAREQIGGELYP